MVVIKDIVLCSLDDLRNGKVGLDLKIKGQQVDEIEDGNRRNVILNMHSLLARKRGKNRKLFTAIVIPKGFTVDSVTPTKGGGLYSFNNGTVVAEMYLENNKSYIR